MKNKKIITIICLAIFIIFLLFFILSSVFTTDSNGINMEEYEKIQTGMTMTEVEDIVGTRNNIKCEQINRFEDISSTVYIYKYYGEKKGYATITYELDIWSNKGMQVISKENFNLK